MSFMTVNNLVGKFKMRSATLDFSDAANGENVLQETPVLPPPRSWQECFSTTNGLSTSILHDLRNPLAAIFGCAEMLLGANLDPVQARRLATNILRATGRMQDLLAALTSMTRGDSESIEPCNLRAIVMAAYEAAGVANHRRIEWFLDVPARLEISLARTRVERVFLNLIANALQAIPGSGEIRIAAVDQGDCVRIAVEDSGPGIPAEIRARLFEPFVTSGKERGLGLGLTFCRQTIRDHGGELWLEPAAGARFVVSLPKQSPPPARRMAIESVVTNQPPCC